MACTPAARDRFPAVRLGCAEEGGRDLSLVETPPASSASKLSGRLEGDKASSHVLGKYRRLASNRRHHRRQAPAQARGDRASVASWIAWASPAS